MTPLDVFLWTQIMGCLHILTSFFAKFFKCNKRRPKMTNHRLYKNPNQDYGESVSYSFARPALFAAPEPPPRVSFERRAPAGAPRGRAGVGGTRGSYPKQEFWVRVFACVFQKKSPPQKKKLKRPIICVQSKVRFV